MPKLLQEKLHTPFNCNTHWITSQYSSPSLKLTLTSDNWCMSSIQIHWNSEWFGGFENVLKWKEVSYEKKENNFDDILKMSGEDLIALKNTHVKNCIGEDLKEIQNGSSHEIVQEVINNLSM